MNVETLQINETLLHINGFWLCERSSFTWGKHTKTNVRQGAADRPPFSSILLYRNIGISAMRAGRAYSSRNLLYCTLIDKVFQPKSIGISKLKSIVVCQQSQKKKWLEDQVRIIRVLYVLRAISL